MLGAAVALVETMCAPRKFEQHLLGCLLHLGIIDPALTEPFRHALENDTPPGAGGD